MQQVKPHLITQAPIPCKNGSFNVEFINDANKVCVVNYWNKEDAEHFIIMFDHHHIKPYLKLIGELNQEEKNEIESKIKKVFNQSNPGVIFSQQPVPKQETTAAENKAMRFNSGKLQWSLVHYKSLEPMVKVLMFGAKKYSADNWKKGLDNKQILESLQRHLAAIMDGEEYDRESGLPHIGHIMCNAMFFSYFNTESETAEENKAA